MDTGTFLSIFYVIGSILVVSVAAIKIYRAKKTS